MGEEQIVLELKDVSKVFSGVKALDNIELTLKKGEIRGLVGENGAGKSTLIKIITGAYSKDTGIIKFQGMEIGNNSPIISRSLGIYAVYQDVTVAPHLTVAENFFLGRQPKKGPFINWGKMYNETKQFLENLGLNIDVFKKINELSLAQKEMINIAKSIWEEFQLVIFDEPTAVLTKNETKILYQIIRELKKKGTTVIYISHNLEEVFDVCDRVTVLKDGKKVGTYDTSELESVEKLIPLMVGREISEMYPERINLMGKEIFKVDNITGESFENISFSVRTGEIVGLFGLIGSGRTEIAKAIFGVDPIKEGRIIINGSEVQLKNPKEAMLNGIGYLPEDRKKEGLFLQQDIDFNININNYDKTMWGPFIRYHEAYSQSQEYVEKLSIKIDSLFQPVSQLSGGNQQKVIIARWLCTNPEVLIFDEPTVGIDVGTKVEIYKLFENILSQGKGIVFISSYLPELMGISDRIYVVSKGKISGEVEKKDFSEEYLLTLAMKNFLSRENLSEEETSNV